MLVPSYILLLLMPLALGAPSAPLANRHTADTPAVDIHSHDVNPLSFFAAHRNSPLRRHPRSPVSPPDVETDDQGLIKVRRPRQVVVSAAKGERKRACQAGTKPDTSNHFAAPSGDAVFPVAVKNSWTTVQGRSGALSFDSALKPLTAGKLPPSISAPDGFAALQASYPSGTVKYSSATGHGYSFYTLGAHNGVDVTSATEVEFSYSVYFSAGFDFVKGGKLPGLYGGVDADNAKSCSGGRQDGRDDCFSARMMWRADGAGELYNYFPVSGHQPGGYCSIAPKSVCDANYGDSIGRGSFYFPTGKWTTVTQRLRLNYPASASNGEQELFVNGQSVLKLTGLQIRVNDATKIYGIMAQTFFGGSDQSWASSKDQWAWFKDWSLGVVY